MLKSGDVVLAKIQFADNFDVKIRPALVLFNELGNVVVAGITSNIQMKGIPLLKKEGAIKNSVIKPNYIFTISDAMVKKTLFHLNTKKKKVVFEQMLQRLDGLNR